MDKESTAPVQIGDVLAGKYRIERILGAGGMGVVVEAIHIELDQRVALKFMLPAAAANEAAVERFAREARASAKLRSDNVVHVTDVGTLDSGAPFMVMEYLEGEDLAQILKGGGPLTIADAIDYVLQGCAGLAEAHAAGIIHRDLKPANLFLARRDDTVSVVKIVDFGISKVNVADSKAKLTSTSDLMGSPLYMSPEQLTSSRDVDARTDIWSLGIILYELLAGAPPFDGDTLPQVCAAVLVAVPPPILEKRPDLPAGLPDIVAKCLQKKAGDRYANVSELADALAEFAPPHSSATLKRITRLAPGASRSPSIPDVPRPEPTDEPNRETASPWTPAETKPLLHASRKRTWGIVAFAAALAGVVGALVIAPRISHSPQSLAPQPTAPVRDEPVAATPTDAPAASIPSAIASASAVAVPSAVPSATAARKPAVARPTPSVTAPPAPSQSPALSASPEPEPPPAPSSSGPTPAPSSPPPAPAPSASTPPPSPTPQLQ